MEATHDKYNRGNYSVGRTYRTGNYRLTGTVGSVISGSFFFSEKEGEPESDPEPCGISTGACGSGIAAIASGDSDSGAVEKSVFMEENCVKRKFVNRSIHKKSEKGHSVIRESSHRVCLPCKRPGGGKAWYIYETGRQKTGQSAEDAERDPAYVRESGTTGCTAEAGIRTVCQIGDPHPQSVGTDGKSFSDRWDHLLYRAGNPELYRQCAGNGSPDGRQLVFPDPGVCIGGTHGTAYLSQDRQMGRCRSLSTHHRLCQFRDSPGGGIPERRTGIRHRLQDIHHCRTCDPVRNLRQLGVGTDLLGAADVRDQCRLRKRNRSSHFYCGNVCFFVSEPSVTRF